MRDYAKRLAIVFVDPPRAEEWPWRHLSNGGRYDKEAKAQCPHSVEVFGIDQSGDNR